MQQQIYQGRNFRERLAQCVKADGRAKKAIASAAGVHASALSRWLAGSTPDYLNIEKLASTLGVSVNFLLFGREPETAAAAVHLVKPPPSRAALHEDATPYGFTPRHDIPLGDALAQIRADLLHIETGPTDERRRVFLFMREAHLPMLARALHLD